MPLIQKEQARHSARKNLLAKMERHLQTGRKLRDEMRQDLGRNDPMSEKMKQVMETYERAFAGIAEFIKKGENIEGFNTEG
jgi:transcriptional regulator of met regulon